ncbi:oligopeptide transport system ATP-binding protein [Acetitomaculum ruminis DSM 5522]|uniref:Oligopeptide transport system ATP-binding protein n=1 Tax=Acetitomaculum ruminis DSM 5522 TaxID=1120918 RepID=A0A1I0ZPK3_9FIRM|nr:ATP-binding cassette domain-containing protein [Acetitomaculum ruminis]SFB26298.1 oligopeptide transport system ATP-binding protein [Acetitomaculum ruminis DSM 5522]
MDYLIEAKNIKQHFKVRDFIVKAVDDVSFGIAKGEVFGLVGETGCGKSTIARILSGIYKPDSGEVYYKNHPVSGKNKEALYVKQRQEEMQIVFQDSAAALNPKMTVEDIVLEPLLIRKKLTNKSDDRQKVVEMLEKTGLTADFLTKTPGELSGGQRQRVAIARSLIVEPKLIIADEPIASLDISIQAQIINLLKDLQEEENFSCLFVAHDLSVVRYISNRVGVMYMGKLVETGDTEELFNDPKGSYTKKLLSAITL